MKRPKNQNKPDSIRNSQNKRSLLRRISNLEWCATISHANEPSLKSTYFVLPYYATIMNF